jgi:hypothetical protein
VKLSVDGFALFVFPLIPFPKLHNSCSAFSFPGVQGGGSKFPHSCGLVASKEGAGLKPIAYMQTAGTERAKNTLG